MDSETCIKGNCSARVNSLRKYQRQLAGHGEQDRRTAMTSPRSGQTSQQFRLLRRNEFRCLVHVSVATGDQAYASSDILVRFVGQIREGHAKRPIGCFETAAVQENDSVCLGKAEGEIERMDGLLQGFNRFVADILPRPELKIDQAVVGVIVRIGLELKAD